MIILITGKPGTGKSTVIEKLIKAWDGKATWVLTREILDGAGERVGFRTSSSTGKSRIISHKHDIESSVVVGQNHVDVSAIDEMFDIDHNDRGNVFIVDEIGPMQLLSRGFTRLLARLFRRGSDAWLIATIHATDKRLANYRSAKDVVLIRVTQENRDDLAPMLAKVVSYRESIDGLPRRQQRAFFRLLADHLSRARSVQFDKLLDNALGYVTGGKVRRESTRTYTVYGNHGNHIVTRMKQAYGCDCDLYLGKGLYDGKAGICSHIQAAQINR